MTVAGWKAVFARLPDNLEVAMGDTDPMSDGFVLAEPYEPTPVRVVGKGIVTAVVVGMSFGRKQLTRLRDPKPSPRMKKTHRLDFDEGDMPGEGF